MAISASPKQLSDLQLRKKALEKRIVTEKRRLRDQSRTRASIRARVVGTAVLSLCEKRRLPENVVRELQEELLDRVFGDSRSFEALQGSALDLTSLLHEISEPIEVNGG
jgi:hypothetical protein